MQRLRVHAGGRYLEYEDGSPFFYLADTAWDLFQRLTKDEIEYYLSVRAAQGFTAVQCVLLGGTEPADWPNKYGRCSVKAPYDRPDFDTDGPYSYWDHVEWTLERAETYGIALALVPMWHAKYDVPGAGIFTGYEAARTYGRFLGERFREHPNLIWMFGGDVDVKPHMHAIFQGMADGIRETEGDIRHLVTFHPGGRSTSAGQLGGDPDYLDFHSAQSGHTVQASYEPDRFFKEFEGIRKPFLDTEAHYEDHVANWMANFRRWSGDDIREGAYESVFAGACGQTYGNPLIAFFLYEPLDPKKYDFYIGDLKDGGWMEALRHEGASALGYLKKLRLSRPYFEFRPAPELVANSEDDYLFGRILAGRGEHYAFIYSPCGREIRVDCSSFDREFLRASWFNPRTGEMREICLLTPRKALFVPETRGKGQDWVLVLDNDEDTIWREHSSINS